ncbi:hypothetical protein AGMMS50268_36040 [Spirochaetia bacterium]|nr:hypothetical protein AGMMS50268_36040 [Spirochaetia bacterium]
MQIKKISIRNVASFIDFSNDTEFKKNNVIFGQNGSGKSTLVNVLKYFSGKVNPDDLKEYLKKHVSKEAADSSIYICLDFGDKKAEISYNVVTNQISLPKIDCSLKIFDENYTEKNIGENIKTDISNEGIIIGEKNIELEEKQNARDSLEINLKNRLQIIEDEVNSSIARFREVTESSSNVSSIISKENLLRDVCDYQEDGNLIEKRRRLGFSKQDDVLIKKIDENNLKFQFTIDEIESICTSEILSPEMSTEMETLLKNYTDFFKSGIDIIENDATKCPFCQRPWPESKNAIDLYKQYMKSTYNKSRTQVMNIIQRLDSYKTSVENEINSMNSNYNILKSAAEKYSCDLTKWNQIGFFNNLFNDIIQSLNDKYTKMDITFSIRDRLKELEKSHINSGVENNKIIEHVNSMIGRRTSEVRQINIAIAENIMKAAWLKSSGERDNIKRINDELKVLNEEISGIEDSLGEQNTMQIVVNNLLQYIGLSDYYINPENRLCLKLDRGYDISNEAKRISTAQKKIISLCYFFAELLAEVKKIQELKNYILVYDDPVDSADYIYFHSIASVLEKSELLLTKIINKGKITFGQVFVLTHNSLLYDRLNKWAEMSKAIEKIDNKSVLCKASKQINNYQIYIKEIILFIKTERPNARRMILIGNIIRRVLEILASFDSLESNNFQDILDGMGKPKLALLANHLSHDSFSKVLNPFSSSDELKNACFELLEVIKEWHPNQYETIRMKYELDTIEHTP